MTTLAKWARDLVVKASRGTVTTYVPNAPKNFGQPLNSDLADAYGQISPRRMQEIILKTPTAAAARNAIVDFASQVSVDVRNVNPAIPADDSRVQFIKTLLKKPNKDDTWFEFERQIIDDLICFGYAGVEIEPNRSGGVANLYVVDGSRLRVDFDEHGAITGYNMLDAFGTPITDGDGAHAWKPNELIFIRLDPRSNGPYGKSRVIQLYAAAVLECLMMNFIGGRFTDSNIPFGVFDLGDISQEEIQFAIDNWNEQASKSGDHRIIITGSRGGAKWMPFGYHLKDLDASNLLMIVRKQIMGVLGVTANELGESEDINKSNGYNLSFVFKKRALEPILTAITTKLTSDLLHSTLGYRDLELYYAEIDSRDELLSGQIDDLYMKIGVVSPNQIRNRRGDPNVDGGDETYVYTGRDWIPLRLLGAFAEAQLMGLMLTNATMQAALLNPQPTADGEGATIKPTRVNPPAMPEQPNTPLGIGSATAKVQYPQVKPPNQAQSSQRPRGAVQTLRNAGMRKEDAHGA
jgi:phage portal protein BeeE